MEFLASVVAAGQIAAAMAVLAGMLVPLGQGNIASHAIDGIARQPESRGAVQSTLFIGCALSETSGLYGLVVSILLLFANPLLGRFIEIAGLG